MRARTVATLGLVALIVGAPLVQSQSAQDGGWHQLEGGPERSSVASITIDVLDVRATYDLLGDTENLMSQSNPGLVSTPSGLQGVAVDDDGPARDACEIVRLTDPRTGSTERGPRLTCDDNAAEATVIGYAPGEELLLVCSSARTSEDVLLEALDARTGETVWTMTPADLGMTPGVPSANQFTSQAGDDRITCGAAAIDEGTDRAAIPVWRSATRRDRVALVDLRSPSLVWSASIDPTVFSPDGGTGSGTIEENAGGPADFLLQGVTWTEAGIVAVGELGCQCSDPISPVQRPLNSAVWAAAWLDETGQPTGGVTAPESSSAGAPDRAGGDQPRAGSLWATSSGGGSLAGLALGEQLVLVDPQRPAPVAQVDLVTSEPVRGLDLFVWPGPAWYQSTILVPLLHSLSAYGAHDLAHRWTWMESLSWQIADVHVSPPGTAYVLVARNGTTEDQARLVELNLNNGRPVRELPLPIDPVFEDRSQRLEFFSGLWAARLIPVQGGSGLLVLDTQGQAVYLGEAPSSQRPSIDLSDTYPDPGEPVTLRPSTEAGDAIAFHVAWGNGTVERLDPGASSRHSFPSPGRQVVRVTAVYPDGTTATDQETVDVGGEQLNLMQRAFADRNQDMTWGFIGLAIALTGGAIGLARKRRRRNRLGDELDRIEAIRAQGLDDPQGALKELETYRRRLRRKAIEGDLDDGQFTALREETTRVGRSLRRRVLGPLAEQLTPAYQDRLEAALEDGLISESEREKLLEDLDDEPLEAPDRERLQELLEAWGEAR